MKLSPFLDRKQRAIQAIAAAETPLAMHSLPGVRLRGTTNGSQGITQAGRRARRARQRALHDMGFNAAKALGLRSLLARYSAVVVRVVRVAPRPLDGDNLEATLKRVRDGVAKCIGVDDRDPRVEYLADAERGRVRENGVRFEVYAQDELRRKLNDGPHAGRAPITDAELAQVRADAAELVSRWSAVATPNVRSPR